MAEIDYDADLTDDDITGSDQLTCEGIDPGEEMTMSVTATQVATIPTADGRLAVAGVCFARDHQHSEAVVADRGICFGSSENHSEAVVADAGVCFALNPNHSEAVVAASNA